MISGRRLHMITKQWLAVALTTVLALLLLGHCFGSEEDFDEWQVPAGQPEQMWSLVDYDPELADPFFLSDEWSCPDGCKPCATCLDGWPVVKNTASCYSTSFGVKHPVHFCKARLLDEETIDLLIHKRTPAFRDALRVWIRNGKFTCQYWILDGARVLKWTTTRQQLTLDKKTYRKGDVIKGRIDYECLVQPKNPKDIQRWKRDPTTTIKVFGVFKTAVE